MLRRYYLSVSTYEDYLSVRIYSFYEVCSESDIGSLLRAVFASFSWVRWIIRLRNRSQHRITLKWSLYGRGQFKLITSEIQNPWGNSLSYFLAFQVSKEYLARTFEDCSALSFIMMKFFNYSLYAVWLETFIVIWSICTKSAAIQRQLCSDRD